MLVKELLGSFDHYAERFSKFWPVFESYPQFKDLLNHFTQGNCSGCRKGDCRYPNCGVASCYRQKGVDFCFQCEEFPCEKTTFDPDLRERWIKMNNRMKEKGVEAYLEETKDLPVTFEFCRAISFNAGTNAYFEKPSGYICAAHVICSLRANEGK